ncbi:hypothetical protein PPYR_00600 [Photinus pyralis]|uniref:Uncharacterized protein n=1 Tax=Photinus pyralis TaxID=7054 RepID=A0A1Y1KQN0_PHOPY|nr:uncharacterized protein LOC116158906 [Photinus pyralis]KAB0803630.1 hypothetical protein PPYR_00600 [Photinus pyralis]
MKLYLLIALNVGFMVEGAIETAYKDTQDHYWREYTGLIPHDAFIAGTNRQGLPIYIGQTFFKDAGLLPTTIDPNSSTIEATAWGKVLTTDKNVKILCSQNPGNYSWVPTKIENMHLLTQCNLVVGGTESETTLYVGRVIHELEMKVGKVFPNFSDYKGLGIPHNGGQTKYNTFEVLAYNCLHFNKCLV